LGGGRPRLGGGRPIEEVVCLISLHFHFPLTTSDVLQLLLALVAPMWWRVEVLILITYTRFHSLHLQCSLLRPLLGLPPRVRMAAELEHDVVTREQGYPVVGNSTKRYKPKGAYHAFDWEALEDPNICAEKGWKNEKEEYWSSKTCKKYVKMCHIDKLWPKECHAAHTKSFACRPWTCNDDHFIHRAKEVWRELFRNREKSKGLFNYGLIAMVYAELKLERKVDWSTYPTTTQYPLCIGKTAKDIIDMYTLESAATKGILGFLRKKLQGASSQGSLSRKEATPKATHDCETSNPIL
jgi:hypothetical protein